MTKNRLTALLRRSAFKPGASTRFCPDDETIAGFVDDGLDAAARRSVVHHLYDCPACIHRVGQLVRLLRDHEIPAPRPRANRWQSSPLPWASAASVLIVVGWLAFTPDMPGPEFRDTRNVGSGPPAPEILAPGSGIVANSGATVIRWTEVPGATGYDIVIVTEVGDVVFSRRVAEPRLLIGGELGLERGRDYYVRVDARLADEVSIRSEHILLRVVDQ